MIRSKESRSRRFGRSLLPLIFLLPAGLAPPESYSLQAYRPSAEFFMPSLPGRQLLKPLSLRFKVTAPSVAEAENSLRMFIERLRENLDASDVYLRNDRASTGMIELSCTIDDGPTIRAYVALATDEPTIGAGSAGSPVTWRGSFFGNFIVADVLDMAQFRKAEDRFNQLREEFKAAATLAITGLDGVQEPVPGISLR